MEKPTRSQIYRETLKLREERRKQLEYKQEKTEPKIPYHKRVKGKDSELEK